MQYISLYRKYRPKKFDDVVGQKMVVNILKNSIINDKISHAYIFSGPRGTGKTSIAKIFSKAVNCLNKNGDICDSCDVCTNKIDVDLDIIEIDAASNNGVDEIREIRNTVKLMPTNLKYRVYIIDEVHMLSISAFNALLKTLEEPPSYAIFILATTEINKIPSTVLSRCQKFDFKKISNQDIFDRLKYILKSENRIIDDDILLLISELSNGGLRDAINLLDQVLSLNKNEIKKNDIYDLIGDISNESIFELLDNIVNNNIVGVIKLINEYYESGKNFIKIINKLENVIKDLLLFNNTNNYFEDKYENILINYSKYNLEDFILMSDELFKLNNELKINNNQKVLLEIYFLKICMIFKKENESYLKNDNNKNIITKSDDLINNNEKNKDYLNYEEIVINNCLCEADKKLKENFISKSTELNEFINNKKYNSVVNLLLKSNVQVVSKKEIILTFKNNFETVLFYKNLDEIKNLYKKIMNEEYDFDTITEEKWNIIKNEYIKNKKNGVKYEYKDLKRVKYNKNNKNDLEENLDDIFGNINIMEE